MTTKISIISWLFIAFAGSSLLSGEELHPLVNLKLSVHDDLSQPVHGAEVTAYCHVFPNEDNAKSSGFTNKDGVCLLKLRALGLVDVVVGKEACYPSISRSDRYPRDESLRFDPFVRDAVNPRRNRDTELLMKKEVDLEASIILRKIKNPIPLYGKRVSMDIPARDIWLGYDFEVGDWVKPYGKGINSDMRIRSVPKLIDPAVPHGGVMLPGVASLEIDFGPDGGLVRVTKDNGWLSVSEMKMPHLAPEIGYSELPSLKIEQTTFEDSSEKGKANGYFFRTRVKREGDKIVSANYGKLWGMINFRPAQLEGAWWGDKEKNLPAFGSIEFTYYFNPKANDRNLEFDIKKNFFTRLDPEQWVRQP